MPKSRYASVADVLLTAWDAYAAARAAPSAEVAGEGVTVALDEAAHAGMRMVFDHPDAPKFFAALQEASDRMQTAGDEDSSGDEEGDAASPADEQLTDASSDEEVATDLAPLAPTGATENPAPESSDESDELTVAPLTQVGPDADEGAMLPETAFTRLGVSVSPALGARAVAARAVARARGLAA